VVHGVETSFYRIPKAKSISDASDEAQEWRDKHGILLGFFFGGVIQG
jgi:hypothetical protein